MVVEDVHFGAEALEGCRLDERRKLRAQRPSDFLCERETNPLPRTGATWPTIRANARESRVPGSSARRGPTSQCKRPPRAPSASGTRLLAATKGAFQLCSRDKESDEAPDHRKAQPDQSSHRSGRDHRAMQSIRAAVTRLASSSGEPWPSRRRRANRTGGAHRVNA